MYVVYNLGQLKFLEDFGGFWSQTPPLSLTQYVTAYQFLGPCDIVLPRHESFQVGHLKANIEIKWPASKLTCQGKTMSRVLGQTQW